MAAEMSEKQNESDAPTLQAAGEETKLNAPDVLELDLHDRDPNELNDYVKVQFEDIIAEPDKGTHSFDKIWILSYKVFTKTRLWCYRITSLIFALPLSACWGIYFACLSVGNIWICVPCIKAYTIKMTCVRRFWELYLGTFLAPCFDVASRCCSNIRLHLYRE